MNNFKFSIQYIQIKKNNYNIYLQKQSKIFKPKIINIKKIILQILEIYYYYIILYKILFSYVL